MDRQSIRTYSKCRPKSFVQHEKVIDHTIFEDEDGGSEELLVKDQVGDSRRTDHRKESFSYVMAGRKVNQLASSEKSRRKLRSLRKTDGHQTTPLKKEPLQIVKIDKNTRKKKINDCETSGREQVMKNTSKTNKKGGIENIDKTKKKYSAVFQGNEFDFENDKEDAEESIERLRKDVAMTWQQKISMFLPKMDVGYKVSNEDKVKVVSGKPMQKTNQMLDISAVEIEENDEENENEDDYTYTYTWVTASATKTTGQTTGTGNRVESSKENSEATLVPVKEEESLNEIKKKSRSQIIEDTELDFFENDKDGLSVHQQWNSTIQKNAKNIKDYGFPVDISSVQLSRSRKSKEKKKGSPVRAVCDFMENYNVGITAHHQWNAKNIKDCCFPVDISSVRLSTSGKSKGVKPQLVIVVDPECDLNEKDKAGLTMNQPWNSTINKNAKNIKDCGFPSNLSSVRLSTSAKKRTPLQQIQETTPTKSSNFLVPPKPKKKKIDKQLCSTKMFLTDQSDFMIADLSSINKVKANDSIELARDKSPFVRIWRNDSPITPIVSPKKENEQIYTSTPTKDKNKEKEFPEFDISSVQIPEFEDDELPVVNESRVVNSQEIVCESLEEDVPEPAVIIIEEAGKHKQGDNKDKDKITERKVRSPFQNCCAKSSENLFSGGVGRSFGFEDDQPELNVSVIPINKSVELVQNISTTCNKNVKSTKTQHVTLKECCISSINVPVIPMKLKCISSAKRKELQGNIPLDAIQCG